MKTIIEEMEAEALRTINAAKAKSRIHHPESLLYRPWQEIVNWTLIAQLEQIKATNRLAAAIEAQVELAERSRITIIPLEPREFPE